MKTTSDWRSVIKVHPAADLFPLMGPEDLKALADDIKAHGLSELPAIWKDADGAEWLIDGRNRLDALAAVGGYTFANDPEFRIYHGLDWGTGRQYPHVDPYTFVVSANIHRRHLTTAQKGELIEALLKATPEKSDRDVAATVKVDHKTVGAKRAKLEAGGEIPQVAKRAGRDGKGYAQKKQPPAFVAGPGPQKIVTSKTNHTTGKALTAQIVKLPTITAALRWPGAGSVGLVEKEETAEEEKEQEELEKEWAQENWEDRVLAQVPAVDENVEDSAIADMDEDTKLMVTRAAIARIRNEARVLGKLAVVPAQQVWVKGLSGWLGTFERDWLAVEEPAGGATDEEILKKLGSRTEWVTFEKRQVLGVSDEDVARLLTAGKLERSPKVATTVRIVKGGS